MFNIGPAEIMVILVLALIVFGPKRLPEIGRTVGKSLREFRKTSEDVKEEIKRHMNDDGDDPAAVGSTPEEGPSSGTEGRVES